MMAAVDHWKQLCIGEIRIAIMPMQQNGDATNPKQMDGFLQSKEEVHFAKVSLPERKMNGKDNWRMEELREEDSFQEGDNENDVAEHHEAVSVAAKAKATENMPSLHHEIEVPRKDLVEIAAENNEFIATEGDCEDKWWVF